MSKHFTRLAFTDRVKREQERYGTRGAYARLASAADPVALTAREADFIETRDGFYLASVGENGWPYVQFRGGPKGFLRVLDATTLGYADFRGNGQYISTGNLRSGGKAALILMDYPHRRRLKIWAEATIDEADDHPESPAPWRVPDHDGRIERLVTLRVQAFDWNCPRHITPRYTVEEIRSLQATD